MNAVGESPGGPQSPLRVGESPLGLDPRWRPLSLPDPQHQHGSLLPRVPRSHRFSSDNSVAAFTSALLVQMYLNVLQMGEGWLIDADNHWIWRFHRDEKAWIRDPKVFIDRGRQMPVGPPLLKERRYLRKDAAEQMWKSLQTQGWKKTKPPWGATAEP